MTSRFRRLTLAAGAALATALAGTGVANADQRCYYVAPHSGRQAPQAAYALHVYDVQNEANPVPIFKAYANIEGWYYVRVYPGAFGPYIAKLLWHNPGKDGRQWFSNYSEIPAAACFFVPGDQTTSLQPDPAPH